MKDVDEEGCALLMELGDQIKNSCEDDNDDDDDDEDDNGGSIGKKNNTLNYVAEVITFMTWYLVWSIQKRSKRVGFIQGCQEDMPHSRQ